MSTLINLILAIVLQLTAVQIERKSMVTASTTSQISTCCELENVDQELKVLTTEILTQ